MTKHKVAIAVFVKTPGVSPLKTRLAAEIGTENAESFHRLATRCVQETLLELQEESHSHEFSIKPYWSVAEEDAYGHELWSAFPKIGQGTGGLGERMHQVYTQLLSKHDAVFLMGADSPQISTGYLRTAIEALLNPKSTPFVMGPANDGGFVLLGGCQQIPLDIWQRVPYSQVETGKRLVGELQTIGETTLLGELIDVDLFEDLKLLLLDLENSAEDSGHLELKRWIQSLLKSFSAHKKTAPPT
ncbi:MAG: DUF2064 domain-containing protein [Planctomycetaceae bacterium]|jgi:uncharacterized protein|nr:DUF2064 domain-containing protein [Planctomycetaceae bacterium]